MMFGKARYAKAAASGPEAELLLFCAQASVDSKKVGRAGALLRGEIDWDQVLRMTGEHGMVPLLYRYLNDDLSEPIPTAVMNRLQDLFDQNKLHNLLLAGELVKILELFEHHGVPAIPYKGPVLAAWGYGDLALRSSGDLDLLLRREHILKARDLLISRGYSPRTRRDHARETVLRPFEREYGFTHNRLPIDVELQWEIAPEQFPFPLNIESLRERLRRAPLGNSSVLTLSPEDLLLVLCVHGAKHFWERLQWICDIAKIVAYHEINWKRLMRTGDATGSERMLSLGLFLASDLLGADLPEGVSQGIRSDPAIERLAGKVYGQLFQRSSSPRTMLEDSEFYSSHPRIRKLRYWLREAAIPNHADWLHSSLPNSLFFLHYVLRPVRLVRKYGRKLLEHDAR